MLDKKTVELQVSNKIVSSKNTYILVAIILIADCPYWYMLYKILQWKRESTLLSYASLREKK